ncbi:MAG: hypothetical protein ACI9QQ_002030, partial [Myxococcota bacterium]
MIRFAGLAASVGWARRAGLLLAWWVVALELLGLVVSGR